MKQKIELPASPEAQSFASLLVYISCQVLFQQISVNCKRCFCSFRSSDDCKLYSARCITRDVEARNIGLFVFASTNSSSSGEGTTEFCRKIRVLMFVGTQEQGISPQTQRLGCMKPCN